MTDEFSPHYVPTVRIVAPHVPGGFIVINADDLQPGDEIYGEDKPKRGRKPKGIEDGQADDKAAQEASGE